MSYSERIRQSYADSNVRFIDTRHSRAIRKYLTEKKVGSKDAIDEFVSTLSALSPIVATWPAHEEAIRKVAADKESVYAAVRNLLQVLNRCHTDTLCNLHYSLLRHQGKIRSSELSATGILEETLDSVLTEIAEPPSHAGLLSNPESEYAPTKSNLKRLDEQIAALTADDGLIRLETLLRNLAAIIEEIPDGIAPRGAPKQGPRPLIWAAAFLWERCFDKPAKAGRGSWFHWVMKEVLFSTGYLTEDEYYEKSIEKIIANALKERSKHE